MPLQFIDAKDKALYFLKLMKTLLLSRTIAKSPLSNASDIRALHAAKVKFETKGYEEGGAFPAAGCSASPLDAASHAPVFIFRENSDCFSGSTGGGTGGGGTGGGTGGGGSGGSGGGGWR